MPSATDHNLLFGILAMQMDFISREQLIAAVSAWVREKSKPLGEILVAQKALRDNQHAALDAIIKVHLETHGNDPGKSLIAGGSVSVAREALREFSDSDIQASLAVAASRGALDRPAQGAACDWLQKQIVDHPGTLTPSCGDRSSDSRFIVLREHAKGGLGLVYVARDRELDREVALKEILPHKADNAEARARFIIEAEITGGLEHPGIVPVYGLGHHADGRPFYAMRFIRGDSLWKACERFHQEGQTPQRPENAKGTRTDVSDDLGSRTFNSLEFHRLLRRFIDVCNAVAYAHSRGVLHRDLKPGNIMLGKYGETLVVDWGLAKVTRCLEHGAGPDHPFLSEKDGLFSEPILRPPSASDEIETLMGTAIGTPAYMSPEQAAGRLDLLSPASDIYSMGATLYVILTGTVPFKGADTGEILRKVERGEFQAPRVIKPLAPRALEAICLKAMATKPEQRYTQVAQLVADIEHWLADEPVSAWPEPFTVKTRRWIGRHRAVVASAAAVLLVSTGLLIIGTMLLSQANADLETSNQETNIAYGKLEVLVKEAQELAANEKNAREAEKRARLLAMTALRRLADDVVERQKPRDDSGFRAVIGDIQQPYNAYDAACALARCVAIVEKDVHASESGRAEQMQFYADQAFAMLQHAVAKGFRNGDQMRKDPDLAPLRQREDFKELLTVLEATRK